MFENIVKKYVKMGDLDTGYLEYYQQSTYLGAQVESREYQHSILIDIHKNQNSMIASARQMGKTMIVTKYIEWYSSMFENRNILILGSGVFQISNLLKNTVPILAHSKTPNSIRLKNQTVINLCHQQKTMNLRGYKQNDLIWIDEPTTDLRILDELRYCNPSAKIIITGGSTPEFIKFYNSTESSSWYKLKITWDRLPRSSNYLDTMKSYMSEEAFYSEIGLGYLI
jgi:hypothetical protein